MIPVLRRTHVPHVTRTRRRLSRAGSALPLFVASAIFGARILAACSDDGDSDRIFDAPDGAPDGPDGDCAPPDAEQDASIPDANVPRDPFDAAAAAVTCGVGADICALQITAGRNHFCARMQDGTVRCWGDERHGALGAGGSKDGKPTRVPDLTRVAQISASGSTTCARLQDGAVWCWGDNRDGQLGLSASNPVWDQGDHPDPSPVDLGAAASRIVVGPRGACALLTSGALSCWGSDGSSQLARPDAGDAFVRGPGAADVSPFALRDVALGTSTSLGITQDGYVVSWGEVSGKDGIVSGRLSSISPTVIPELVRELESVTSLAVSPLREKDEDGPIGPPAPPPIPGPIPTPPPPAHAHACAIAKGEVHCWGRSDWSALCTGIPDTEVLPASAPIAGKAWPQSLALGDEITCARMTDGTVQCCGDDTRGRLGTGALLVDRHSPYFQRAKALTGDAVEVAASSRTVCALLQDGSVSCWGSNQHGELALAPDEDPHPLPVKVTF